MTYRETVNHLYTLRNRGTKLGLGPMEAVLRAMDDPHRRFASVHVGGTNGKGTVSGMVASILRAAGLRCGLYTSPHLVSFTERIVIDDEQVGEDDVVRLAGEVLKIAGREGLQPTFFEVATAVAFARFAAQGVEWVVAEVGLGGRLDATNVLQPAVSVITNVAFDHQAYLGESIEEIAGEKAGIIKPGIPACTGASGRALEVIRRQAENIGAPLNLLGEGFSVRVLEADAEQVTVSYEEGRSREGGGWSLGPVRIPMAGEHNAANAALAIRAARLLSRSEPRVNAEAILSGLSRFKLAGRIERVPWGGRGTLIVDPAHNPAAAETLAAALKKLYGHRPILCIVGILDDKDVKGVLTPLLGLGAAFIATQPRGDRALPAGKLAAVLAGCGVAAELAPTLDLALKRARQRSTADTVVLVTGSFYTVGEVKEILGEKGTLSSLRE